MAKAPANAPPATIRAFGRSLSDFGTLLPAEEKLREANPAAIMARALQGLAR